MLPALATPQQDETDLGPPVAVWSTAIQGRSPPFHGNGACVHTVKTDTGWLGPDLGQSRP